MRLSDFQYELPPELIAQRPSPRRGDSRLLVLGEGGRIRHRLFPELLEYFREGDLAVFNNTRVFPARLRGVRADTGGRAEVLLLHQAPEGAWEVLVRPARRARPGTVVAFDRSASGTVRGRGKCGWLMDFTGIPDPAAYARQRGEIPLPPYIRRSPADLSGEVARIDAERYQTVYAAVDGAVAAPTAGLHFTPELLERMREQGVEREFVTLHVGYGTFQTVREEDPRRHRMQEEYYEISEETAARINHRLAAGGRLWAIGTTTVRALESAAGEDGRVRAGSGWTDIFIVPGYRFRLWPFSLVTNFHLPASTLLMLVAALSGRERILEAYAEAVREGYRFFSYGDAMAILA